MAIDKHSSEFLFGQIMARLDEGDTTMKSLVAKVDAVQKVVNTLPCDIVGQRVSNLEKWQNDCIKNNRETARAGLSFRYGLIIALSSATIGSVASVLVGLFGG